MVRFFVILFSVFLVQTPSSAQIENKIEITNKIDRSAPRIASGKTVYLKNCAACHQKDGLGIPSINPPLSKTSYTLGSKEQLIRIVLGGFNEQIEIDGDTYINAMPSFSSLSDGQIADVLTYVRNNFGNKASAVKPIEVRGIRAKMFKK